MTVAVGEQVAVLKARVCSHLGMSGDRIDLLASGTRMGESDTIKTAFERAYKTSPVKFPSPYLGVVWAVPR